MRESETRSSLNMTRNCGMLDETCVDLDRYPNDNIAEHCLTLGTENFVEMSGYTCKTGVHALHERQQVQDRVSGHCKRCEYSEDHRSQQQAWKT